METIDADRAANLIFDLFIEKPWLNQPGELIESDFQSLDEAIDFLHSMTFSDVDSFGDISIPARRIVTGLLQELMASLIHPESSLRKGSWDVDESKRPYEQALMIISVEIVDSHRRSQLPH